LKNIHGVAGTMITKL